MAQLRVHFHSELRELEDRTLGGIDLAIQALDPVSTLAIEELMQSLKSRYTIVIVTHNMQQAARVADKTAFMLAGELVEFDETDTMFTNPGDERTEQYVSGKCG